jgi:DUF1365 family protein
MPARVLTLIHWQALRLWVKRTRFYRKPAFVPGHGSVKTRSVKNRSVKR